MYKILNITNIHALDVWVKRILICNNKIFFLCFFSVYFFCNATFFHSGCVIKLPQPSSAIYGPPPFTRHHKNAQILKECLVHEANAPNSFGKIQCGTSSRQLQPTGRIN